MMWPRRDVPPPPVQPPQVTEGILQARAARAASRQSLLSTIETGQVAREVAERVLEHERRNHFGELLTDTYRRRPAP